ncbi:MAG: homocysteine S-methyltransferase family protein [Thermomicrobiales bacterium]
MALAPKSAASAAYRRLDDRLKSGGVVVLDGGIGSELQEVGYPENAADRPANYTWGSIALHDAPDKLVEVHRRYAEAGADILETHTFFLNRIYSATQDGRIDLPKDAWQDLALKSVALVREGAAKAGRDDIAVAFACRTQDWSPDQFEEAHDYVGFYEALDRNYLVTLAGLLANADAAHKPDLILMEIQSWIPENLEFPDYQIFLDTGIPLWVSYRRTIGGTTGVEGVPIIQDGERFGEAARVFEQMGISAVLVNCLPPEYIRGVATWLRQYTSLPLGAYPNVGKYLDYEWDFSTNPTAAQFVVEAKRWIDEGMQIVGGCCGTRPEHIRGLAETFGSLAIV